MDKFHRMDERWFSFFSINSVRIPRTTLNSQYNSPDCTAEQKSVLAQDDLIDPPFHCSFHFSSKAPSQLSAAYWLTSQPKFDLTNGRALFDLWKKFLYQMSHFRLFVCAFPPRSAHRGVEIRHEIACGSDSRSQVERRQSEGRTGECRCAFPLCNRRFWRRG